MPTSCVPLQFNADNIAAKPFWRVYKTNWFSGSCQAFVMFQLLPRDAGQTFIKLHQRIFTPFMTGVYRSIASAKVDLLYHLPSQIKHAFQW